MIKLEDLTIGKVALELIPKYREESCLSNLDYCIEILERGECAPWLESNILDELEQFFSYHILSMCGCGAPETVIEEITKYLQIVYDFSVAMNDSNADDISYDQRPKLNSLFGVEYVTEHPLLCYMAYDLDSKELIEHGTSINNAWITDLGVYCLFVYNIYLKSLEPPTEKEPVKIKKKGENVICRRIWSKNWNTHQ